MVCEVCKQIALIRKACGVSQRELAKRTGILQQTISKIENGKRIPRVDTFSKIITALGYEIIMVKEKK